MKGPEAGSDRIPAEAGSGYVVRRQLACFVNRISTARNFFKNTINTGVLRKKPQSGNSQQYGSLDSSKFRRPEGSEIENFSRPKKAMISPVYKLALK